MRRAEIAALVRLDAQEIRRSRWPAVVVGLYLALAAVFVFAGVRESSVLGFTGTGRVLLSWTHGLVLLLPLLAVAATTQTVNRAREDGTLELLFGNPASPAGYYSALAITRFGLLFLPLAALLALLPAIAWAATGDPIPWGWIGRTTAVGATLSWAFVGIGLALSVFVANQARAVILGLLAWALAVALLDLALVGVLLAWRLDPASVFLLAALNPVQCARMALLSGLDPELSSFGPVGFFLAQRLGSGLLLALGLAWPLVVGWGAWCLGLRRFRRGDLI